ncbi:Glyceraldehyde-3-phosphate dehydrogenase (phosphorylating) [Streptococcus thermophilus CNCM I-1630]|nr:Glyceraldehyde-3-phosphate dehydrogenase (phosphorylating) [Streptococcus thermophilus CNCM I-1630]
MINIVTLVELIELFITATGAKHIKTMVSSRRHDIIDGNTPVISGASCTTNCLAPMAKALNDTLVLLKG